jgi:hypothetical protein
LSLVSSFDLNSSFCSVSHAILLFYYLLARFAPFFTVTSVILLLQDSIFHFAIVFFFFTLPQAIFFFVPPPILFFLTTTTLEASFLPPLSLFFTNFIFFISPNAIPLIFKNFPSPSNTLPILSSTKSIFADWPTIFLSPSSLVLSSLFLFTPILVV